MDEPTKRAIEKAGGPTALAKGLGIKMPSLYSWSRIPAERVGRVSEITGIPRHELRPDLWEPPAAASQDAAA